WRGGARGSPGGRSRRPPSPCRPSVRPRTRPRAGGAIRARRPSPPASCAGERQPAAATSRPLGAAAGPVRGAAAGGAGRGAGWGRGGARRGPGGSVVGGRCGVDERPCGPAPARGRGHPRASPVRVGSPVGLPRGGDREVRLEEGSQAAVRRLRSPVGLGLVEAERV